MHNARGRLWVFGLTWKSVPVFVTVAPGPRLFDKRRGRRRTSEIGQGAVDAVFALSLAPRSSRACLLVGRVLDLFQGLGGELGHCRGGRLSGIERDGSDDHKDHGGKRCIEVSRSLRLFANLG